MKNQIGPLTRQKNRSRSAPRPGRVEGDNEKVPHADEQQPHGADIGGGEDDAVAQGAAHAVEPAGAPVLPEDWADGAGEGEQAAEGDRDQAVDDGAGRDHGLAEARHDAGHEAAGDGRRELVRIAGSAMANSGRASRSVA